MNDKLTESKHLFANPVIIAEIGCNHQGNFELARNMIEKIAEINQSFLLGDNVLNTHTQNPSPKISVVKFQKRTPREFLTEDEFNAPHPNPNNSFGDTYGKHRDFLEFSAEEHIELKKICEQNGLIYSVSVWDLTAAKEIVPLKPLMIKIPAASNLDFNLSEFLSENYSGEIHISLGMTTKAEENKIIEFFAKKDRLKDVVLYACTSCYPCNDEDTCLLEISRLKETYGGRIKGVGFSGHHSGTVLDIAAYTLGAEYLERHFTLDKTLKGTDQSFSLEPDEIKQLAENLYPVRSALCFKPNTILPAEQPSCIKLKRKF